jgi:hypothetical protein
MHEAAILAVAAADIAVGFHDTTPKHSGLRLVGSASDQHSR